MAQQTVSAPGGVTGRHVPRSVIYFFASLGALAWGYDNGVLAGALLYIKPELHLTPTEVGLVGSALALGSMVGAVVSGFLANPLGRKRMIFVGSIVFIVGVAVAVTAPNTAALIGARVLLGAGVGVFAVSIPIYLAEISPAGTRGRVGALTQLMIAIGILLAYIGNLALSPFGAWRLMFAIMFIPAVAVAIGVWVLPESPRWLLARGRDDEARRVLGHQVGEDELETTLAEMRTSLGQKRIPLRQLMRTGAAKIIIVVIIFDMLTQLLGINTIVYYSPSILKQIGFSDNAALVNTIGFGIVSVVFTIIASRVIDRWGRRPLLIVGGLVMGAAMAVMATLSFTVGLTVGISGFVAIGAIAVFKATFSLSWGTGTRIVIAELLPTRVRGSVQGVAQIFNQGATSVSAFVFPLLLATGSGFAFGAYAVMGVIAAVFVGVLIPETKGQTLEEIEAKVTASNRTV